MHGWWRVFDGGRACFFSSFRLHRWIDGRIPGPAASEDRSLHRNLGGSHRERDKPVRGGLEGVRMGHGKAAEDHLVEGGDGDRRMLRRQRCPGRRALPAVHQRHHPGTVDAGLLILKHGISNHVDFWENAGPACHVGIAWMACMRMDSAPRPARNVLTRPDQVWNEGRIADK